uniref:Glycosyltransferase 2-like domain-containing protein n=1 Tax=viral metagenome TaxID=1070528 RepID=A0A6C0EV70_9ZZZZ
MELAIKEIYPPTDVPEYNHKTARHEPTSRFPPKPLICLNMIVKDESHIIIDTLTKLLNKVSIDYWVISDTGSTDNTQEIIKTFFKEKDVPGELYQDKWENFAHNRTLALEHAHGKSEYIFVFDADDELCGDFQLPVLTEDAYHIQFGDANGTSYTRVLLVNNNKKWRYLSVIHEFIDCLDNPHTCDFITGNYYCVSGRSGNRSKDPDKYLKDALVLEKAHAEALAKNDLLYFRYAFYCANSYFDYGKYVDAIKWYKITLGQGNWEQEKYVSCLRLFNCYNILNKIKTGLFYLVKGFLYDKTRVECLYELVQYYCNNDMNKIAYMYYEMVKEFYEKEYYVKIYDITDKLFVDISKANLHLPYWMIIVADRIKKYDTGIAMYRIIFIKKFKETNKMLIENVLFNLQFFIDKVDKNDRQFFTLFKEYIDFLLSLQYPVFDHDFMINYEKYGIIAPKRVIHQPTFTKEECATSNKILIYTGFMNVLWNDSYVSTQSIGGAEKAVTYLSRYFPKNYEIIISGDVADEVIGNITYINRNKLQDLLEKEKFHTIVVSRYVSFFLLYRNFSCYQLFLSAHDSTGFINHVDNNILSVDSVILNWNYLIDGVITLTNWHKDNVIAAHPYLKDKMHIVNNGILTHTFPSCKNKIKNKFVWTSCSYRGLYVILHLWKDILENIPDATLDISSYNAFPENEDDVKMLEIMNKYNSIKHHGMLNTTQLYDLISKAEYWLYTNTFPETSCITGLEMLMSEVICLYYPLAGLLDTVGNYGIQVNFGNEINTILNLSEGQKIAMRKRGREYALSCSWENRAKEWCDVLCIGTEKRSFPPESIDNHSTTCCSHDYVSLKFTNDYKKNIYFYVNNRFILPPLLDYFDSLKEKYSVIYTSNVSDLDSVSNSIILFVICHLDIDIGNYLNKNNNVIGLFNTEPLNIPFFIVNCIHLHKKYPNVTFYDYSNSNLYILKHNNITNVKWLSYIQTKSENNFLKNICSLTSKIYDFGIVGNHSHISTNIDNLTPRRKKIVKYLLEHGFSVNIVNGWKEVRDNELAKCKFILNIHGQRNENPNPSRDETSNIFEHIRCDRLLGSGFQILSEESLHLDSEFIDKYPNLKIIKYEDFFKLDTYNNLLKISSHSSTNIFTNIDNLASSHPEEPLHPLKKIIDCFTFYNELDILTYRLNLLNDVVDYFVLVEANHTHCGNKKKLFFNENKHLYTKFQNKIIHIVVDLPYTNEIINNANGNQWINEKFQRNAIRQGLSQIHMDSTDLIIISDVDEIPDPNTLKSIKSNYININILRLEQDLYYYNLNSKRDEKWYHSKIISYKKYKELNINCDNIRFMNCDTLVNGGWCLSYFGSPNFIKNKIDNCINLFNLESNDDIHKIEIAHNTYLPPQYDIYLTSFYSNNIDITTRNLELHNWNIVEENVDDANRLEVLRLYSEGASRNNIQQHPDDFIFLKCFDQVGCDLYNKKQSVPILKESALKDPNCVAFNTMGWFKNNIQNLSSCKHIGPNEGIYIKTNFWRKM